MQSRRTIFMLLGLSLAGTAVLADLAEEETIHAQPSWVLRTPQVQLAVTRLGGHMAPVTFYRHQDKPVRPYHISPWQEEKLPAPVPAPVLAPLRGDFFCMPFGGNSEPYRGEKHPPHGEVAGNEWEYVRSGKTGDVSTLILEMDTKVRKGNVAKHLSLVDGQNVVYSRHVIRGFAGKTPLGHHATLSMPGKGGAARIATSPYRFGMTNPTQFSNPENGEYQSLAINARFTDLKKVPLIWKGSADADLTRLPARRGHSDLLLIANQQTTQPAWITVTIAERGYVWYAFKDPKVLPSTVFWIENRGRHGNPWNGRNNCLGLEDVAAFFADGLAPSARDNALTQQGVRTALTLTADRPTEIRYIQGAAKVPAGFAQVRTVTFAPGKATFISTTGQRVTVPVRHEFLKTGRL